MLLECVGGDHVRHLDRRIARLGKTAHERPYGVDHLVPSAVANRNVETQAFILCGHPLHSLDRALQTVW